MKCPECGNPIGIDGTEIIRSLTHARELWSWASHYDMPIRRRRAVCMDCGFEIALPPVVCAVDQTVEAP